MTQYRNSSACFQTQGSGEHRRLFAVDRPDFRSRNHPSDASWPSGGNTESRVPSPDPAGPITNTHRFINLFSMKTRMSIAAILFALMLTIPLAAQPEPAASVETLKPFYLRVQGFIGKVAEHNSIVTKSVLVAIRFVAPWLYNWLADRGENLRVFRRFWIHKHHGAVGAKMLERIGESAEILMIIAKHDPRVEEWGPELPFELKLLQEMDSTL